MEYKDILKNDNFESDFIGYRDLTSSNIKILTGGARKKKSKSKKAVEEPVIKKRTKKSSKKGSRKSSKMKRTTDDEDFDTEDDDEETLSLNQEIEKTSIKKQENEEESEEGEDDQDEDDEKVDEDDSDSDGDNNLITVEEEEQNDFISEGDDDKSKTPFSSSTGGNVNYKKMYEKLLNENKSSKSKSKSAPTKTKSSKTSSKKKSKGTVSDSSTINMDDTEQGSQNIQNLQNNFHPNPMQQGMPQQGMPPGMQAMQGMQQNIPGMQGMPPQPQTALGNAFDSLGSMKGDNMKFNSKQSAQKPSFDDAPAPTSSSKDLMKESGIEPMFPQSNMKMGSNTNMNSVLEQLDNNSLVPIIPEMQHYFSDSAVMQGQAQGQMPPQQQMSEFGGKPEIMDKGLMGQSNGAMGGLPMYGSDVAGMANAQGMGSAMMGGGKNVIYNNEYENEINNIIMNEFNSTVGSANFSIPQTGGSHSNKKKKNFFLTKKQIVPSLHF